MTCKRWTLATVTLLLLMLSLWSFINAILLCMSKYMFSEIYLVAYNDDGSLQKIKTTTTNTITVVNTSLFVY
ncbi:unnamed protein product [Rotaria sordida]|uniref:Uncharacterized protein n=1 Tax=Rotaria sordida TaxID=392033 RepID=A0A814C3H6_9BILA|nr:unnamed protein product [Rotaria sordida]CAF0884904.1 unnamed protein product [Rotaria sordida]CAF0885356.1 unnamed protein product [Rotaria sordida]CAF0897545.1 unnamed protein product [Rotaria sordida]CAF0935656.1 unnamed protein product [Rotaria sordida]